MGVRDVLQIHITTTGEILEIEMNGIEQSKDFWGASHVDEWEISALEAILKAVPHLVGALEYERGPEPKPSGRRFRIRFSLEPTSDPS
jgi:hypothetical protein